MPIMFPLTIAAILSQQAPDIEKDIQKQLDVLGNEIILSLTDCEREFLSGLSKECVYWWVTGKIIKDRVFFETKYATYLYPKILASLTDEMLLHLAKKFKLLLIDSEMHLYDFRLLLTKTAAANIFVFQECSIDSVMNDIFAYPGPLPFAREHEVNKKPQRTKRR
jgi:hypothetical protein